MGSGHSSWADGGTPSLSLYCGEKAHRMRTSTNTENRDQFMVELTCQDRLFRPEDVILTRRQFLSRLGMGFGALSLTSLIGMGLLPAPGAVGADLSFSPFIPRDPHFTPKSKLVLHI